MDFIERKIGDKKKKNDTRRQKFLTFSSHQKSFRLKFLFIRSINLSSVILEDIYYNSS